MLSFVPRVLVVILVAVISSGVFLTVTFAVILLIALIVISVSGVFRM